MWADIEKISAFSKEKNLILIADEAHGTHTKYISGISAMPDISVLSFHKNLPLFNSINILYTKSCGLTSGGEKNNGNRSHGFINE